MTEAERDALREYEKLKPEIKGQWLAALRSGEYQQARNVLRTADGHCCLGVLCDLMPGQEWHEPDPSDEEDTCYRFDHDYETPTRKVQEWASLDSDAIDILTGMNDGERKTFPEIADWIEKNL